MSYFFLHHSTLGPSLQAPASVSHTTMRRHEHAPQGLPARAGGQATLLSAQQIKIVTCARPQVLNVAEKNSIAAQVSSALSNNSANKQTSWCAWALAARCTGAPQTSAAGDLDTGCLRSSSINPLFFFQYAVNGAPCDMVFTSVAGHLLELDFTSQHRKWNSCSPDELYTAPVQKVVPQVR